MFCAEIIGPLVRRVMRALGIDTVKTKNYIAPEQTVECIYNPELGGCFTGIALASIQTVPPEKLYFSVDGTVYECEKKLFGDEVVYGNLSIAGEPEDTGEPFLFMYEDSEVWEGLFKGEAGFSVTLSAWTQTEKTTPISDKYLPGVCLPVVELTTEIANEVVLTAEESAKLTAAAEQRLPAVLRFPFADNTMTAVAVLSEADSASGFGIVMGIQSIQFFNEGGTWSVVIM